MAFPVGRHDDMIDCLSRMCEADQHLSWPQSGRRWPPGPLPTSYLLAGEWGREGSCMGGMHVPNSPSRTVTHLDLHRLQRKRKRVLAVGTLVGLVLLSVTDSAWRLHWQQVHSTIQWCGLMLILICILGRTWVTVYIGGLKKRALVTKGPYSVVRNPLYLFTLLGAAGIGALFGSLTLVAVSTGFATVVFLSVLRQEEQFLMVAFPREFPEYVARVPRLLPRPSVWKDADHLIVQPQLVRRTFLDASLFLMAVPLAELIDLAQNAQLLPILLRLP